MATIVIVHGMFDGGWSWRRVVALLQAAGHEVFSPTLTGLGERSHLANPAIDLETHVQDILHVLQYEDLADVRLVGHSMAGFVIASVADRARERLARLIYLDAHVPENGESFLDLVGDERRVTLEQVVREQGDGWRLPPPSFARDPGADSQATEELWRWFQPRLAPQPFKTLTQPVKLTYPSDATLQRAYILCAKDHTGELEPRMERIRANPAWRWREIDADHLAHVTAPETLANALLALV
jgi:pimeloyl-ACP methyl ester carboxylesterase